MSLPITAVGPLNVLMKPILMDFCWALSGPADSATMTAAAAVPAASIGSLRASDPARLSIPSLLCSVAPAGCGRPADLSSGPAILVKDGYLNHTGRASARRLQMRRLN